MYGTLKFRFWRFKCWVCINLVVLMIKFNYVKVSQSTYNINKDLFISLNVTGRAFSLSRGYGRIEIQGSGTNRPKFHHLERPIRVIFGNAWSSWNCNEAVRWNATIAQKTDKADKKAKYFSILLIYRDCSTRYILYCQIEGTKKNLFFDGFRF